MKNNLKKILGALALLPLFIGCATGPVLSGTTGNMIFLGEPNANLSSCGYDLAQYISQAKQTCSSIGFSDAKVYSTNNSSNQFCRQKFVSVTFICQK
jgi:hypothetical protein